MSNIALVFGHRERFLVQPGIFNRNTDRGSDCLEQILVVKTEFTINFIQDFNHPDHPSLGNHGNTQSGLGCKTRFLVNDREEVRGLLGIVDHNGLTPGGDIAGNPLSELEAKFFHGLDLHIKRHRNFQLAVLQEQERTGFHIHDLPDHVHGVF